MASFKRLNRSDIISVPYVANKNWVFEYCPYPENDQYIKIYKGTNVTGSFSLDLDPVTEGQYERLIYSQINHLFYQNFTSSLSTSSLESSLYYDAMTQTRATHSYFNYNDNPLLIKTFPTGAMEGIRILSIDQDLYGQQLLPYAFELSSSAYYVKDDGIGNLIDYKNSNVHIGNIFYSHGLVTITNQDYQLMFPVPPLAGYKEVTYLDTDSSRIINLTSSVDGRGGNINTGSLILSDYDYSLFTDNDNGTTTFSNVGLGTYKTNFTFDATLSGSNCADKVLTSNKGTLKINVVNNCAFSVTVVENPFPTPAPTTAPTTPTTSPTTAPTPISQVFSIAVSPYEGPCATTGFFNVYVAYGETLTSIVGTDNIYSNPDLTGQPGLNVYTDGINIYQLTEGGNENIWSIVGSCNATSPPTSAPATSPPTSPPTTPPTTPPTISPTSAPVITYYKLDACAPDSGQLYTSIPPGLANQKYIDSVTLIYYVWDNTSTTSPGTIGGNLQLVSGQSGCSTSSPTTSPVTPAPTSAYSYLLNSSAQGSGPNACSQYASFSRATYYSNQSSITTGTYLYTDGGLTNPVTDGYYSNGTNYWYFGGGNTSDYGTSC
jgi:hypothetical protein